jgi:hypothetical protein
MLTLTLDILLTSCEYRVNNESNHCSTYHITLSYNTIISDDQLNSPPKGYRYMN